ncbi:amidase family protein [Brevibacillus brevis]|nr:amidase family protein [Brevibacillus brevis]
MNELTYLTATELGTWIRERKISAEEATRHIFKRINSLNGKVNAIVAYDEKAAFEAAKQADKEIGEGIYRGPLHEELPGYPTSRAIRNQLRRFVKVLEQQGMHVEQVTAPPLDVRKAWETWGKMIDAELNSTTPTLMRGLAHLLNMPIYRQLPTATMLIPLTFKNYMRVLTVREQLIRSFEQFMADCDLFLCPVSCTTAFPHMEKSKMWGYKPLYTKPLYVDENPQNYWAATTFYTNLFNVTGSPVVTMPIGFDEQGLPIGIQCVGKRWRDRELLQRASTLYATCPEWRAPAISVEPH